MKRYVFVGPTAYGIDLSAYSDFEFLPPASCGDILWHARRDACAIGLVDGYFHNVAAVWHKEILFAINNGCCVYGAASMGALRAAECHPFGMIGLGKIFNDYRRQRRVADSDVALQFGPRESGFMPLSVPFVDAEFALKKLLSRRVIDAPVYGHLINAARHIHFAERNWSNLFANAGLPKSKSDQLLQHLRQLGPLQKTRDFLLLLNEMQKPTEKQAPRRAGFYETRFFARLLSEIERP